MFLICSNSSYIKAQKKLEKLDRKKVLLWLPKVCEKNRNLNDSNRFTSSSELISTLNTFLENMDLSKHVRTIYSHVTYSTTAMST